MLSPETVIFAIKAGLQLYGAARKAYADNTRGRPLVLPLPRSAGIEASAAISWFTGAGQEVAQRHPRVVELLNIPGIADEEKHELTELYVAIRSMSEPDLFPRLEDQVDAVELNALLTVRNWASGRYGPDPTALQTLAGTLVNIGIDYFLQKPGAISEESAEGRALKTFLTSLDKTDFANTAVTDIAPTLMIAVLETVSANPDLVGGGEKEQLLVRNITDTMLRSTKDLLENAPSQERKQAALWVQLIARSLIKGASDTVLANPQQFFNVDDGESELIRTVGGTVTELLVGESKVTFQALFSQEGLNRVVKAALAAVAANPNLVKLNNQGLKNVLVGLADALSKSSNVVTPDIFPELVRLTLEKSAENLELIWGSRNVSKPERNLLILAAKTLLTEISRKPPAGSTWQPTFTKQQILATLETVADEVVDNPEWLVKQAGAASPTLGVAVKAILESLRRLDGSRVSAEAGMTILQAGLRAVALRADFLNELPDAAGGAARQAISLALDAIFESVFAEGANASARWTIARNSTLAALTKIALDELAQAGVTADRIARVRETVEAVMNSDKLFDLEEFQAALHVSLAA